MLTVFKWRVSGMCLYMLVGLEIGVIADIVGVIAITIYEADYDSFSASELKGFIIVIIIATSTY